MRNVRASYKTTLRGIDEAHKTILPLEPALNTWNVNAIGIFLPEEERERFERAEKFASKRFEAVVEGKKPESGQERFELWLKNRSKEPDHAFRTILFANTIRDYLENDNSDHLVVFLGLGHITATAGLLANEKLRQKLSRILERHYPAFVERNTERNKSIIAYKKGGT